MVEFVSEIDVERVKLVKLRVELYLEDDDDNIDINRVKRVFEWVNNCLCVVEL